MADTIVDDRAVFTGIAAFYSYSMVFVPFTGIDNHNNNVSFGAALLASETAETYKWFLRCFLKAFGKQPDVVVTEQDPAMKKAIEEVFTGSRHRLCMWHVMHKLLTKVGVTLCNTTDFKQRICDIVWTDSLSPAEFEVGWHSVIQDFDLSDNNWLADIYDMRELWIPAYYRDELMSGLMRTTSRSESENHFFGQEEAIVKAGKKSRQCQNCKEYGHYASTCSKPSKKTGVNTKEKTFYTMSADS
ncbi:hypothetical protein QVD17_37746 [Tagetes erecta]|uniref:MULE transposase domain-containing protein n=1 Tax=Tagetes erecta TaxID=13708 RepID=A0AAD8JUK9_TARER|nr:hypothetical protein QVD17_37746 [Tagetes erecta]